MPTSYSQYGNSGKPSLDYGSYSPNGFRTGPVLNNAQGYDDQNNITSNPFYQPRLGSGAYNQNVFGNGVLLSPLFTYSISAEPVCFVSSSSEPVSVISTMLGDGANAIRNGTNFTILTNKKIPSTSFNQIPFASIDVGNPVGFQMDWPRSLMLYARAAAAGASLNPFSVRVSGYDFYGNRMTEELPIPTTNLSLANTWYSITLNYAGFTSMTSRKAFYLVTKATVTADLSVSTAQLFLGFSYKYGLPYRVYYTDACLNAYSTFYTLDDPIPTPSSLGVTSTVQPGIYGVSGKSSYDVRGTILTSIKSPLPTVPTYQRLTVSYYIYGADAFRNQAAALQLPVGNTSSYAPTPPLKLSDLYGVPQYYDPQDF